MKPIERLYNLAKHRKMKLGLETMKKACESLGNPQDAYPTIHVAGTNGKGSTCFKIAKCLELGGYKVGLYTSPHLFSVCERIQINGKKISMQQLEAELEPLFSFEELTFFEIMTLIAFSVLQKEKVDVAVIEVGLGGRLDATNVIHPILSVITSIQFDHMSQLGHTLDQIAKEKGGIIKTGIPLVVGPKAKAFYPEGIVAKDALFFDEENQEIAKMALEQIKERFPKMKMEGLQQRPLCRFEKVGSLIFDVAHNPDGFRRFFEAVEFFYPSHPRTLLVGMSQDKDAKECLKIASRYVDRIFCVPTSANCLDPKILCEFALSIPFATIEEGMNALRNQKGLGLVCGSFYLVGPARQLVDESVALDFLPLHERS